MFLYTCKVSVHDRVPLGTERTRELQALTRARHRVEDGERGRARNFQNEDIDRARGGPSRPLG